MKRKRKQSPLGFTLIETVISLCILSVVLLGMSSMVFSVIRATAQSKEMATATTLLQDKMENLKNISIGSLTSGSDSASLGNITYLRQWAVSTVGNLKTITVTVNWTSRRSHDVSVTSLRGEYGLNLIPPRLRPKGFFIINQLLILKRSPKLGMTGVPFS